MKMRGLIAASVVAWLGIGMGVNAAEQPRRVYEEVIVTAQRTEQSVQDVPIAVTAFTGEMMEQRQIITPSDLQMNTPNLSFTATNFGGSNFAIRGIGNLVIGASEGGVSIHQSEIAMGTNLVAAEFYDVERVEVLRGPQGTLYGKQATGGVINFVAAKPQLGTVGGHVDVEYGDYDHQRAKGALNVPVGDTFALRFAGMRLKRDGYTENTAYGQVGTLRDGSQGTISGIDDDVDGRDIVSYRITGLWQPTERLSAWVQYASFREEDDRARITNQVCKTNPIPTVGCDPNAFGLDAPHLGATTGGLFSGLLGASVLGDPVGERGFPARENGLRQMHTDFEPVYVYNERTWLANVSYEFDQFTVSLEGGMQGTFYLSQQDYLMDVGSTLYPTALNPQGLWPTSATSGPTGKGWTDPRCNFPDGTAGIFGNCILPVDQTRVFAYDQSDSEGDYWTAEVKVQSNFDGRVNFLVGANLSQSEAFGGNYYVIANTLDMVGQYPIPELNFPPLYPTMFNPVADPDGSGKLDSTSYFGEVYFQVTDRVKITAGLRYNDDRRKTSSTSVVYNALDACYALRAYPGLVQGCADGPVWQRSALAPWYTTILTGGLVPVTADARALTDYYGVTDAVNAAIGLGNPVAAVSALNGVPKVPLFNETRDLTGSPTKVQFDETTGRIGVDWALNDDTMVYAFYTRGYKPGGFNPPINPEFQSTSNFQFDSETIDAFEVGTKNVLLDGQLVVNGSVFYYDYQGLQITRIVNNSSLNENVDGVIFGAELEGMFRPSALPRLSIDYAYSYLRAEADGATSVDPLERTGGDPAFITLKNIDSGANTAQSFVARRAQITQAHIDQAYSLCRALSADNPLNGAGCPEVAPGTTYADGLPAYFSKSYLAGAADNPIGLQNTIGPVEVSDGFETNIDGNQLPQSPEHKIRLGIAYDFELAAGVLTPRLDYYWQGESYGREFNTPGDKIDAWDQFNASLTFVTHDGRWQATLWGRNLQNEDNVTGHYLTSDTSGFYRNYFLTEPRIWGASLRYNFGAL